MASRLETILSYRKKKVGGGNLKSLDGVEVDNDRNTQTF
jgi:hypothetical protein